MGHDEDELDLDALSRRQLVRRGLLIGSVAWSAPVIESIAAPAFGQNRSPAGAPTPTGGPTATPTGTPTATATPTPTETPPGAPPGCGRMTGGGSVGGNVRYGFVLHCRPGVGSDNLTVSFKDPNGAERTFHLDTVTTIACSDQAGIDPTPPGADFDTMEGSGTGHLRGPGAPCTNTNAATISFKFVDAGEPSTNDLVHLFITCGSTVLLDVTGPPTGGDVQAHDDASHC